MFLKAGKAWKSQGFSDKTVLYDLEKLENQMVFVHVCIENNGDPRPRVRGLRSEAWGQMPEAWGLGSEAWGSEAWSSNGILI